MTTKTTAKRTEEEFASASDEMIDTVTYRQQEVLESMESAQSAVIEGVTNLHREVLDFVSDRIRQDMQAQQELLGCRSLDEVRDVQTRFFKKAVDQYSTEATRLMKLGSDVFARSLERRPG